MKDKISLSGGHSCDTSVIVWEPERRLSIIS